MVGTLPPHRHKKKRKSHPPHSRTLPRQLSRTQTNINKKAEAGLTNEEASEVMKVVRFGVDGTALAGAKSASELLQQETEKLPIYTFCQELDDLLGGGVAVGEITELCGCPGIGKTQMGIQLCTSVQIPGAFGGYDGTAVYIDTEARGGEGRKGWISLATRQTKALCFVCLKRRSTQVVRWTTTSSLESPDSQPALELTRCATDENVKRRLKPRPGECSTT